MFKNTFGFTGYIAAAGVNTVTATPPLFSSGGANPNLTITQAGAAQDGYLSQADWLTFNGKVGGSGTANQVTYFTAANTVASDAGFVYNPTTTSVGIAGIATPRTPLDVIYKPFGTLLGSFTMANRPIATFYVRNGIVFCSPDTFTVYIVDFRTPSAPVLISNTIGGQRDNKVIDDVYYNSNRYTLDLSDISAPIEYNNIAIYDSNKANIYGNVLVTYSGNSFRLVDISNFRSPQVFFSGTQATGAEVAPVFSYNGKFLYLVTTTGVAIYNIINPAAPIKVGEDASISVSSGGAQAATLGTLLYIVSQSNLFIYDVKNPTLPTLLTTFILTDPSAGSVSNMVISGNTLAYPVNNFAKVVIYDLTDRLNPTYRGSITTTGLQPRNLFIEGDRLYVTSRSLFTIEAYSLGGIKTVGLTADVLTTGRIAASSEIVSTEAIRGGAISGSNLLINGNGAINGNFNLFGSFTTRLQIGELNMSSVTPVATPSLVGGTLAAGTYYYRIVAIDLLGNVSQSSQSVTAVIASGVTGSVALTWTAVNNAVSYRIYRGTVAGREGTFYSSATNSFTDTNAAGTSGRIQSVNNSMISYIASSATASGNLARGGYIAPVLTAAANNDVLIGLDFRPTFVNGAFTGLTNIAARFQGRVAITQDALVTVQTASVIQSTTANSSLVIAPNGTGGLIANIPDNGVAGGNARGTNAVDLQMSRTAANQVASGNFSIILGGSSNLLVGNDGYQIIVGGSSNSITASGYSFIGGGLSNNISTGSGSGYGCVAGGRSNSVLSNYGSVLGGQSNTSNGLHSFVGGGQSNTAGTNTHGVVAGGQSNTVTGGWSVVSGGRSNNASGTYATVVGGNDNIASGDFSTAMGAGARSYLQGMRAMSNGGVSAAGDNQSSSLSFRRGITGQSITELFLDGSSVQAIIGLPSGSTNARLWNVIIQVNAIVSVQGAGTALLNDCFAGIYQCAIKRVGSSATLVGTITPQSEVSDTSMATSIVTISADAATFALRIRFTPPTTAAGDTQIKAVATAYLTEVGR